MAEASTGCATHSRPATSRRCPATAHASARHWLDRARSSASGLVTADEVDDPQQLGLRLWVNGTLEQDGTTAEMIFPVLEVVRCLSQFMVLRPGDLVNTGTPAEVALGVPGTPFLRAGDVVELEIDGLGRQRRPCPGAGAAAGQGRGGCAPGCWTQRAAACEAACMASSAPSPRLSRAASVPQ